VEREVVGPGGKDLEGAVAADGGGGGGEAGEALEASLPGGLVALPLDAVRPGGGADACGGEEVVDVGRAVLIDQVGDFGGAEFDAFEAAEAGGADRVLQAGDFDADCAGVEGLEHGGLQS